LSDQIHSLEITLTPFDNRRLINLCGRFDEHLRQIERQLKVEITNRGNVFQILGSIPAVQAASQILKNLYQETGRGTEITPTQVHLSLKQYSEPQNNLRAKDYTVKDSSIKDYAISETDPIVPELSLRTRAGEVRPRSPNQIRYLHNILTQDVNFGIGPAGTGKTFLAVAAAVSALEQEKVRRIVLVRPAVEAGERLGFLPGDLTQKIDPYLRPLYDALYEMLGYERVAKLLERQIIEIASLAYMRGRTLNDAFIILDEGQNATIEQMKMFLTRIGFSSTAVVTGDITQIDLPRGRLSGLKHVMKILQDIPGISFTFFQSVDVVRHPVVQKIIDAYENFDLHKDEYTSAAINPDHTVYSTQSSKPASKPASKSINKPDEPIKPKLKDSGSDSHDH
jgi:phosphate starvation-inducible PhoH-like protein